MGRTYHSWPTPISVVGPASVGAMLWHNDGERLLTVIVKSRFALRHNAAMLSAQAPELCVRDEHVDDSRSSLLRATDLIPYRPRCDVTLVGHARTFREQPVETSVVRLALLRDGETLINKAVHVVGDRVRGNDAPQPFSMMPLVYERAFGGVGHGENPVGVGADEQRRWPNLVDPERPDRVAGLGPIPRSWRIRSGHLTAVERHDLERPEPSVSHGLGWQHFQTAPIDQRTPFLRGDEWLVLDGVHAEIARLQTRLPQARGVARVFDSHDAADPGYAVTLKLDQLAIDADTMTCSLTWRGAVALDPAVVPAQLLVVGGVERASEELDWPRARDDALESSSSGLSSAPPSDPWPMFPLTAIDDEVTETSIHPESDPSVVDECPSYPGQRLLPRDTEPGAPLLLAEEDLPWIEELCVEPSDHYDSVPD